MGSGGVRVEAGGMKLSWTLDVATLYPGHRVDAQELYC